MGNATEELKPNRGTDVVLEEIWRIKETLSAACGHDVDRLFTEARARQKLSGRSAVNLQQKRNSAQP